MTLIDDIRSRRGDPDDPFDQEAARREYRSQRRHDDERDRANVSAGYRARMAEDRERRESEKAKAQSKRRPAARRDRSRTRRSSSGRRMVRQVTAPARQQVASGMRVIGLTLAVVALYLVLTTEEQRPVLSPALNGLAGALRWLAAPDRSIPYAR